MERNFAIIGAAGFVAPRHLESIQGVGGKILAALDPHDSVGILDKYAPKCAYFSEPERFWRWMARCDFEGRPKPNWVSVCSPNWLHDAHVRMALWHDCNVILEKPAVLTTRNLDCLLSEFPHDPDNPSVISHENVFVVHQLRWHQDAHEMKAWVDHITHSHPDHRFQVKITYHTPRGPWYRYSWKGDHERSGGPISNLGIHFLDLLCWFFGRTKIVETTVNTRQKVSGTITMTHADIEFSLSTDFADAPEGKPLREFTIDSDCSFRFDHGFTGLHDAVYKDAMQGTGIHLPEVRDAIALAEKIRLTPRTDLR